MDFLEEDCKCVKIIGHLEDVKWMLYPKQYYPHRGLLLEEGTQNPFIWMQYVSFGEGSLLPDDVLNTEGTKHWGISDPQRHFVGDLHCDQALFTFQYPNLWLPTRYGCHLWKINTASKGQPEVYVKEFNRSLEITIKKMVHDNVQMQRLLVSDQLIKLNKMDNGKRRFFLKNLEHILSLQEDLQLISLENLYCKRLEGVHLLQKISQYNADTLKYLFLWRFVEVKENPILINYSYLTGSGQYIPRPCTKITFLRSLASLINLTVLGLEYSHIADGSGDALCLLLPILRRPHFRLHLICRENQIPDKHNPDMGCGGYDIADTAWRIVSVACPDLYLAMVFFRIRDYDNVRRFLSPSIPLREVHLQYGIDLLPKQRQDSDLSCFVRHIAYRYKHCLQTLSIHHWRFATFSLRRIMELMPNLVRLAYTGRVADEVDLKRMLMRVATGVCSNLEQIKILIQDEIMTRDYWTAVIANLRESFADIMQTLEVELCLDIYRV